jgi:hypothetical protein
VDLSNPNDVWGIALGLASPADGNVQYDRNANDSYNIKLRNGRVGSVERLFTRQQLKVIAAANRVFGYGAGPMAEEGLTSGSGNFFYGTFDLSSSPNKICGTYAFKKTGNGWTGEITGLALVADNRKMNQVVSTMWGALCVTLKPIGNNTAEEASSTFVISWNTMTNRLQDWMNLQGQTPTEQQFANQAMYLLNTQLNMNTLYYQVTSGPCIGGIPSTKARYVCFEGLFD